MLSSIMFLSYMYHHSIIEPNYRALLHEYCQKHGGSLDCDYVEDHSSNQQFRCTITCMVHGKKITGDSGTYFLGKDKAKERAAFNAYSALAGSGGGGGGGGATAAAAAAGGVGDRQSVQSRGSVEVSWVSKLKEHYDKRGQPGMQFDFQVEEIGTQSFVSSVFVPELKRKVKGEVAKSKKEAKQNAAKRALQFLKLK